MRSKLILFLVIVTNMIMSFCYALPEFLPLNVMNKFSEAITERKKNSNYANIEQLIQDLKHKGFKFSAEFLGKECTFEVTKYIDINRLAPDNHINLRGACNLFAQGKGKTKNQFGTTYSSKYMSGPTPAWEHYYKVTAMIIDPAISDQLVCCPIEYYVKVQIKKLAVV